ncbi:hypothetical protein U1Q18_021364, partial [Sarracenia purpurea var. burkii]
MEAQIWNDAGQKMEARRRTEDGTRSDPNQRSAATRSKPDQRSAAARSKPKIGGNQSFDHIQTRVFQF